jgi:hypothetical protein
MPLKFYAAKNSMFWTDKGLKKPCELDATDLILGTDTSGDICWRKVVHVPACREQAECYHIIADSTEIHAPRGIVLCTQSIGKRYSKIEGIERQDKLRVISNPAYIWEKWVCKKDCGLSEGEAFLLGLAYRKIALDQDRVVIKIPTEKIDTVATTVKRSTLSQKGSSKILLEHNPVWGRRKPPWSWLIIESQSLTNLIRTKLGNSREAPFAVRADLKLYQSYVKGLMEVLGKREYEHTIFDLFLDEYDARKLLYNIFFLYAVECKTSAMPSYSPDKIVISVRSSELKRISSVGSSERRGTRSVSTVRWMTNFASPVYSVSVEGTNWSPIVDLVYIL